MPIGKSNATQKFKDTLELTRNFGIGKIKLQERERVQSGNDRFGTVKTIKEQTLVNLPDDSETTRTFVGRHLFKRMRAAEHEQHGIHVKLFEPHNYPVVKHYLAGEQNLPIVCAYTTEKPAPMLPEERLAIAHGRFDLVGNKRVLHELPHQIHTHIAPAKRVLEHFAPVPAFVSGQAIQVNGWVANAKEIEAEVRYSKRLLFTGATYSRLVVGTHDQLPADLPQDHFYRTVNQTVEKWENPTQTKDQRSRAVASYTNHTTRETKEFSVWGMVNEPDNLIVHLPGIYGISQVIFIKANSTDVKTITQSKEGVINHLLKRTTTVVPDILPPETKAPGWLLATLSADGKTMSKWTTAVNPYLYLEPIKDKPKKQVSFAPNEKMGKERSAQERFIDSINHAKEDLEALHKQDCETVFGLPAEALDANTTEELNEIFETLYPAREYSVEEQTILLERYQQNNILFNEFMDTVLDYDHTGVLEGKTAGKTKDFFGLPAITDTMVARYQDLLIQRAIKHAGTTLKDHVKQLEANEQANLLTALDRTLEELVNLTYEEVETGDSTQQDGRSALRAHYLSLYSALQNCKMDFEQQGTILRWCKGLLGDNNLTAIQDIDSSLRIIEIFADQVNHAEQQHSQAILDTFYGNSVLGKHHGPVITNPVERLSVLRPPVFERPKTGLPPLLHKPLVNQ